MPEKPKRPRVRICFRFNVDTGETEFIIDDGSPDRSEEYHDNVAQAIASYLARRPEIEDAGAIRHQIERQWQAIIEDPEQDGKKNDKIGLET